MAKYHVNPATGKAGACRATKGGCPFGSEDQHYSSAEAARTSYEKAMETQQFGSLTKQPIRPDTEPAGNPYQELRTKSAQNAWRRYSSTSLSAKRKELLTKLMDDSYDEIQEDHGNLDTFTLTERLSEKFVEKAVDTREFDLVKRRYSNEAGDVRASTNAAFAHIAPHLYSASRAFEKSLVKAEWETNGDKPLDFEKTFVASSKRVGHDASPEVLADAFYDSVEAQGWNVANDDGGIAARNDLRRAARSAHRTIMSDSDAYERELALTL